jgi:hypothetical protein
MRSLRQKTKWTFYYGVIKHQIQRKFPTALANEIARSRGVIADHVGQPTAPSVARLGHWRVPCWTVVTHGYIDSHQ